MEALLVEAAGEGHLIDRGGEVLLGLGLLGKVPHRPPAQLLRAADGAAHGRKEAQEGLHQGGLAGAVLPPDAEGIPLADGEV